jgi:hypothetical protein
MLAFIDTPKFFRVVRLEQAADGAVKRVRIGRLMKADQEFRVVEGFTPNDGEQVQIEKFADILRDASVHLLRADALRFPEMARRAAEYYLSSATDVERQLIATAALEITRAIRKAGRQDEEA